MSQIMPISTGIFPLYLQDLPDGLRSLSVVYLAPHIHELYLTPAPTHADSDQAEPQSCTLRAQSNDLSECEDNCRFY